MESNVVEGSSVLGNSRLVAFIPTLDPAKAKAFYGKVLGLRLVADETPFAVVFDANGTMLRVTVVQDLHPDPFTVLGWNVASINDTVDQLVKAGVEFLRYPGMNDTDPHAVWTAPSGARVAWFVDPDGNVLSLTQFGEKAS